MPTNARRRHPLDVGGPWGGALLVWGLGTTAQGVAYIVARRDELRTALAWIDRGIPIAAWGALWVAAGLFSIFKALTPPQRHNDVAPIVLVTALWSACYFVYWLYRGLWASDWTRDWTAGTAWGSVCIALICFGRCVNPPTGQQQ